jgi:hypothetical protein
MLASSLGQAAGRTVTYTRGATSWQITSWPGQMRWTREPTVEQAASLTGSEIDYLFTVAAAKAKGIPLPPQRGDRITDPLTIADQTGQPKIVEALPPKGEPHWRYSDPENQAIIRLHCKRAGA